MRTVKEETTMKRAQCCVIDKAKPRKTVNRFFFLLWIFQ